MSYTSLAEDLTVLIDSYADNPLISEHQRGIWKPEGRTKDVTHGMLGRDHPKALRLLEADGYDGQPVGSLSSRSAESFWYYNENHVFPPTDDLIRLCIFMRLDLYRIVAMVLKGKWEEFFAREVCAWRANVGKDLSELLEKEDEMGKALSEFNPDTGDLLSRLLENANIDLSKTRSSLLQETESGAGPLSTVVDELMGELPSYGIRWLVEAKYAPDTFDTLVQTMLLNKLHWVATTSAELDHFRRHTVEEIVVCIQGTDDERPGDAGH